MKVDMSDVLVIVGSLLFGYGLWRIYPPAAYMAIGAWGALFGILGSKR